AVQERVGGLDGSARRRLLRVGRGEAEERRGQGRREPPGVPSEPGRDGRMEQILHMQLLEEGRYHRLRFYPARPPTRRPAPQGCGGSLVDGTSWDILAIVSKPFIEPSGLRPDSSLNGSAKSALDPVRRY